MDIEKASELACSIVMSKLVLNNQNDLPMRIQPGTIIRMIDQ